MFVSPVCGSVRAVSNWVPRSALQSLELCGYVKGAEFLALHACNEGLYRDNGKENGNYRGYRGCIGFRVGRFGNSSCSQCFILERPPGSATWA